jgi:hypothetical protein
MADGADPPVRFAVVRESARTRVPRPARADRTLIVKEPLGPDAGSRLRHETAILERLRGVTGVAQLADEPPRGLDRAGGRWRKYPGGAAETAWPAWAGVPS